MQQVWEAYKVCQGDALHGRHPVVWLWHTLHQQVWFLSILLLLFVFPVLSRLNNCTYLLPKDKTTPIKEHCTLT